MRFVLDEDVDALAVRTFLRRRGHDCWSIVEAGLGGADDDAVAAYADDQRAALVTHDREATQRRRRFTFGRHVWLRVHQLDAVDLLSRHIDQLESLLARHDMGVFEVQRSGVLFHPPLYKDPPPS